MNAQENQKETVFVVVGKILTQLESVRENSSGKAALANLRNSIGRPLSSTIDIWPIVFEQMPEKFLGKGGRLTDEEMAILTTLQIYALHQQGRPNSVNRRSEKGEWNNVGTSLKSLRVGVDTTAIDRRFNTMITASSFEELTHHLRQMVRLLRSRSPEVAIDYARLGNDLYWYLKMEDDKIRLKWAKGFYSRRENSGKEEENYD